MLLCVAFDLVPILDRVVERNRAAICVGIEFLQQALCPWRVVAEIRLASAFDALPEFMLLREKPRRSEAVAKAIGSIQYCLERNGRKPP